MNPEVLHIPTAGTALIDASSDEMNAVVPEELALSSTRRVRKVLLVHAGEFQASTGPIEFDEARIKNIVAVNNAVRDILLTEYQGMPPDGAFTPILDGHEDLKNVDVVGRLIGPFTFEVRDIPRVGKQVPCVTSFAAFLGEETVKQVDDGRVYHVSVGIDDETDLLSELSTVVTPAAPGAMLLAKARPEGAPKKTARLLDQKRQVAKNKLKGKRSMPTPPKANAKKTSRLSALKALVDEGKKVAEMAAENKKETTRLIASSNVTKKLSALVRAGKMTPAEFRKADLKKLAAASADVLDAYTSAFEIREPVVNPGQVGTRDAVDAVELAQEQRKANYAKLKAEAQEDIARKTGKRISKLKAGEQKPKAPSIHQRVDAKLAAGEMPEAAQKLSEQVPEKDARLSDAPTADAAPEEFQAHVQAQQEQIDALTVQMAKMGDLIRQMAEEAEAEEEADEQMGADDGEDDSELSEEEGEESELADEKEEKSDLASEDTDDKSNLSEDADEEKGKKKLARAKAPAKPKKK